MIGPVAERFVVVVDVAPGLTVLTEGTPEPHDLAAQLLVVVLAGMPSFTWDLPDPLSQTPLGSASALPANPATISAAVSTPHSKAFVLIPVSLRPGRRLVVDYCCRPPCPTRRWHPHARPVKAARQRRPEVCAAATTFAPSAVTAPCFRACHLERARHAVREVTAHRGVSRLSQTRRQQTRSFVLMLIMIYLSCYHQASALGTTRRACR